MKAINNFINWNYKDALEYLSGVSDDDYNIQVYNQPDLLKKICTIFLSNISNILSDKNECRLVIKAFRFYQDENSPESISQIAGALIDALAEAYEIDYEGTTLLHLAAEFVRIETLEKLIEKGANVHTKDSNGLTPLHLVAEKGQIDIDKVKGAVIDAKDHLGRTPLHWAAIEGHVETLCKLIERGANINEKDNFGMTALFFAANFGNTDVLLKLIEKGANIHEKDNEGHIPLHAAAMEGKIGCLLELIKGGASVDAQGNKGKTPLHWAVQNEKKEVLLKLIENGANIDAKDNKGMTPLHYAIEYIEDPEFFLKLIEKGANVNAKNSIGQTPLHLAALTEDTEAFLKLIEKGASLNEKDESQNSPLQVCSKSVQEEILISLMDSFDEKTINEQFESLDLDFRLYAFTIPSLTSRLIKCGVDKLKSYEIYTHVDTLSFKERGERLYLLTPQDQMAYLKALSEEEKIGYTQDAIKAIDKGYLNFKDFSPITIALLSQDEYYRNVFAQKINYLSMEQVRVLIPHLQATHWLKGFYRPYKFNPKKLQEFLSFSLPEQIRALKVEDLLDSDYYSLDTELDKIAEELKLTHTNESSQKLEMRFFGLNLGKFKREQMRIESLINNDLQNPKLSEQRKAYKSVVDSLKKPKIEAIENKHRIILEQIEKIREGFEIEIPSEYLDPVTRDLMIPDECVYDPTMDNKQLCNISTLRGSNNQWQSPWGERLSLEQQNNIKPASEDFKQKLRKLHEAKNQGVEALKKALHELGHESPWKVPS